ncbi:MAG: hypothetical protein WDA12_05070 [Bacilli bacterium]
MNYRKVDYNKFAKLKLTFGDPLEMHKVDNKTIGDLVFNSMRWEEQESTRELMGGKIEIGTRMLVLNAELMIEEVVVGEISPSGNHVCILKTLPDGLGKIDGPSSIWVRITDINFVEILGHIMEDDDEVKDNHSWATKPEADRGL